MTPSPETRAFTLPSGQVYTARDLLRRHVEAVWGVSLLPLDVPLSDDGLTLSADAPAPSWALYLGETLPGGQRIPIWRADVALEQLPHLLALAEAALASSPLPFSQSSQPNATLLVSAPTVGLVTCEVALAQDSNAPITQPPADTLRLLRALSPDDADLATLLARFPFQNSGDDGDSEDEDTITYFRSPTRQPVVGIVAEGKLLCVAHSSRRTDHACELGIETHPDARRRGYALACTLRWAVLVAAEGLIPLYSALAENAASLTLAHAVGYRPFARAAYVVG
ncbi:MAG: GNAT family N-acetyltransferase [Ktedonobacterales bacterium]